DRSPGTRRTRGDGFRVLTAPPDDSLRRTEGLRRHAAYVGRELVTSPRYRDDRVVADDAAKHRDGLADVVFFDDGRRPYGLNERGAGHELARMLDEIDQDVERGGRDDDA